MSDLISKATEQLWVSHVLDDEGLSRVLDGCAVDIDGAKPFARPSEKSSMRSAILACLDDIDTVVDRHNESGSHYDDGDDVKVLRDVAEDSYFDAKEQLKEESDRFSKSASIDGKKIMQSLEGYAVARHYQGQLCESYLPAVFTQEWNESNPDDQINCGQLVGRGELYRDVAETGFVYGQNIGFGSSSKILQDVNLDFGPMVVFQSYGDKSLLGTGVYLGMDAPIWKDKPWRIGTEFQFLTRNTYDNRVPYHGELKLSDLSFSGPLFRFGYENKYASPALTGGFWFAEALIPESEIQNSPYAQNPFLNPNVYLGGEVSFLDGFITVRGGYIHTPNGDGGQASIQLNLYPRRKK